MGNRAKPTIAHRLSTVLVVERGRIVERGGRAKLRARGGAHARLYGEQFAGEEPPAPTSAGSFGKGTSPMPNVPV